MELVKDVADKVQQKETMKACHERTGISQQSRVLSGNFGRQKIETIVVARCYFPYIVKPVAEIIKYCDVYQYVNTY